MPSKWGAIGRGGTKERLFRGPMKARQLLAKFISDCTPEPGTVSVRSTNTRTDRWL